MVRRWIMVLAGLIALTAAPMGSAGDRASKIDPLLQEALSGSPSTVGVIVTTHGAPSAAAAYAGALGGRVSWTYSIIDGFAANLPAARLDELAGRSDVEGIYLDRPVRPLMDVSHSAIEANKAWDAGHRGQGITVAVLDTGIDLDRLVPSDSFFPEGTVVSCVSTIASPLIDSSTTRASVVTPECTDTDGHGTHVAGTVASRDYTYPGIAPAASLAIVRVLHAPIGFSSDTIAGMNWVHDNKNTVTPNIRVATMSIGPLNPECGDGTDPESQAANNLVEGGVVFTIAAGNSGHKKCTIDGAAAAEKVITVAAVDDKNTVTQQDDDIADFSSGGPTNTTWIKPEISFPGVNIWSAFLGPTIAEFDGTSMATPHAAGVAALVLQKEPALTAGQVKTRIQETALKTANTGSVPNFDYGYGLGNACLALKLAGCSSGAVPAKQVHVASVSLSFQHAGKNHKVTVTAKIVDAGGAPVAGATVTFRTTSPEGKQYTGSGTTNTSGNATFTAQQKQGGHGSWQGCVTGVSGTNLTYNSSANTETCDSITVT